MPRDNFVMQERKDKFDALMGVLKGPPGPAGKSAYQIAVDNGFVGTPEEWLASLKGPKGDKGDDGKSAYQAAVDGGYQGTEADFNAELADIEAAARAARAAADDAEAAKTGAESAASHYPKIENGNWWVYSAATGAYVDTGISAEGTQGIDGVSPAVTFAEITGGHTMTVTDKTHPDGQSINILNGQNGTDGVSPAISITDIAGGHRLTITDAAHPQGVSMDIMDGTVGPRGPAGPGVPAGGATGKVLIKKSGADYDTEWGDAGTSDALPLAGGTMEGDIDMDGNKVSNLPTPTASGDAVPKSYADDLVTGYRTAAAQDVIDAGKEAAGLGLTGAAVGDLVRVAAVDANGKPTSWAKVTQDDITNMSVKADELAIVINGNTTSLGAAKGQYVILRNSTISGKADGLYTAAKAIPANTAIDGTYLTGPIADGGLNHINGDNYYKPGDSVTIKRANAMGRLVNAKNGVFVGITLDKQITATTSYLHFGNAQNCYATSKELTTAINNAGYNAGTIIDSTNPVVQVDRSSGANVVWYTIPLKATLNPDSGTPYTVLCELANITISFS